MSLSPKLRLPFQRGTRKAHRWPFVVAAVAVLLPVTGWLILKNFVDAEQYRPKLIERIAKATGLYVTVETVELAWFPAPNLQATNVIVGENDFKATCTRVSAFPELSSLLHGTLDIREIVLNDLAATLPVKPGDLKTHIDGMVAAHDQNASGEGGGKIKLEVGRISAPNATIRLGDSEKPVFAGSLVATDVLSDTITITADAESPAFGSNTNLDGTITLDRKSPKDIGLGVHGTLTLTNLETATLFTAKRVPPATATITAQIDRTLAHQVKIALEGNAVPIPAKGADLSAIAGAFTGIAWWDSGQITVNDLNWKAPGLQFLSDITIQPDGSVATSVRQATADRAGLQAFLSAQPASNYRVVAMEGAQATAKDLLIGVTTRKKLQLVSGIVSFNGVELTLPKGQKAISGFEGELEFSKDAINIAKLTANGLSLKGAVQPIFDKSSAAIDLSGKIDLTRERLGMFMPLDSIKEAKGAITLDRISGTFTGEGGAPVDLSISGKLSGGTLVIDSPSWSDKLQQVEANFTATPGAIDTKARAASASLGSLSIDGKYLIADRKWNGTVRGDLTKMDLPFLRQDAARKVAPGILAGYGDSQFTMALSLPTEKSRTLGVTFERKSNPELNGTVAMQSEKSGWALGDVSVNASLPGAALKPMLPEAMSLSGLVPVRFARGAKAGTFDANIDLDDNAVSFSDYLHKRAGTGLGVKVQGVATTGNWAARQVTIICLDQRIDGQFTEKRFEIPKLDISAGALAALLPEGTKAGGRIRGNVATAPVEANLALDNVNVAFGPDLSVDRLNGAIVYANNTVTAKNLEVRGANSNFTLDLVSRDSGWSGALTGQQLDINALLAMKDKLKAAGDAPDTGKAADKPAGKSDSGKLDLNVDTVVFRKAELHNVFTNVTSGNGDVELKNLSVVADGGKADGWVRIAQAHGDRPASTSMSLKLDGVDMSVIDEIALQEPRKVKGRVWGTTDLEFFTGENIPVFSGSNGAVKLTSKDGSFGKLGIATKVLAVLRTLEITRLRAPKLKDEGLTYDTCEAEAVFKKGLMTLQRVDIATPSYMINAFGTIDFNRQDCEILVHVDLMETVLGAADLIPGVSDIVGNLRNAGGLRILVTGPPTDPTTKYAFGPRTEKITDDVRGTVKSTGNIVRDEVLDKAADALRKVLNK